MHDNICLDENYIKLCFNNRHLDELKVSWNDSICRLIHRKCCSKNCHSDIKCHLTLSNILVVVYFSWEFEKCNTYGKLKLLEVALREGGVQNKV